MADAATTPARTSEPRTLAQLLGTGKLPLSDALRHAIALAEALRKLHDEGRAHGALTPRSILLTEHGLELVAVPGDVTPYTAPEALEGRGIDPRTDIFSFGAILYQMLTGEVPFPGEGAQLAEALTGAPPAPSGSPILDRLVGKCLAKDPAARWPRMQKVLLELKLLTVAVRRAESAAPPRRAEPPDLAPIRGEMLQTEARLAARLEAHERSMEGLSQGLAGAIQEFRNQVAALEPRISPAQPDGAAAARLQAQERAVAGLRQDVADAIQGLREQVAALEPRLFAAQADPAVAARLQAQERAMTGLRQEVVEAIQALRGQTAGLQEQLSASVQAQAVQPLPGGEGMEEHLAAAIKSGLEGMGDRIASLERSVEAARSHALEFERNVAGDFHDFEIGLKQQDAAVQSVRAALSQSDDIVERVVEALESLQTAVFEQTENHSAAAAAN